MDQSRTAAKATKARSCLGIQYNTLGIIYTNQAYSYFGEEIGFFTSKSDFYDGLSGKNPMH